MNIFADPAIRRFILHVTNGDVFYVSVLLLTLGCAARVFRAPGGAKWVRLTAHLVVMFGVIFLLLTVGSLTPMWGVYLLLILGTALVHRTARRRWFAVAVAALVICVLLGWRYEARTASLDASRPIIVYGDSLSIDYHVADDQVWPRRLSERLGREVQNRAHAGYQVEDVLKLIERDMPEDSNVILAIGGNDTLGSTPRAVYARGLDQLLSSLSERGNHIIMLEAPAPPTAPWYAWVQRYAAWRHGVPLLPKRVMLSAIFGEAETTVDDLHLSARGHERMARAVAARVSCD